MVCLTLADGVTQVVSCVGSIYGRLPYVPPPAAEEKPKPPPAAEFNSNEKNGSGAEKNGGKFNNLRNGVTNGVKNGIQKVGPGLADVARHVMGCRLTQERKFHNALYHEASNICLALREGEDKCQEGQERGCGGGAGGDGVY